MDIRYVILIALTFYYTIASSIKLEERKCGVHKAEGFIKVNTTDDSKYAALGEFPWTVAILRINLMTCAGSLIQPNVVLTAGHCLKDVKKEELKIKAGLWDFNSKYEQHPVEERNVTQIILHPDFKNDGKQIKNDIALLVLNTPMVLTEHISLACLPKKDQLAKSKHCYAAGWGKENKDGKASSILKKMFLPIITKEDCDKKLKEKTPTFTVPENTICAGGEKDSPCMGDGGTGLVCRIDPDSDTRYVQLGIASSNVKCSNEIPGIYANVAAYRDWIDDHVNKLGLEPKLYSV